MGFENREDLVRGDRNPTKRVSDGMEGQQINSLICFAEGTQCPGTLRAAETGFGQDRLAPLSLSCLLSLSPLSLSSSAAIKEAPTLALKESLWGRSLGYVARTQGALFKGKRQRR